MTLNPESGIGSFPHCVAISSNSGDPEDGEFIFNEVIIGGEFEGCGVRGNSDFGRGYLKRGPKASPKRGVELIREHYFWFFPGFTDFPIITMDNSPQLPLHSYHCERHR
jgi:hypothetical protein